ncbi:general secretion pathway protein D [Parvularcula bermudensis HTCC2503]|uniref:General secretion pathway protein D n=2 Tax=Parvularcula TaxID=208215 RepID=E0TBQ0_PARBH|nr:general secretion pathway protein D [Parvularcula bermudensis HTCC2503]
MIVQRSALLPTALSLLLASAAAAPMTAGATLVVAQQGAYQLNYEGADLAQVAQDVAFQTGRVFVIDPRVSGRVNIVSPPGSALSSDEVWAVFLATLQVNGFAAVPIGEREYKIIPANQASRDGAAAGSAAVGTTVTRVVPLQFVPAGTAAANLRALAGENSLVTPIVESNSLIIVDTPNNVSRLLSVVDRIDVDKSVVRSIPLDNAAASEVAATLSEIVNRPGGQGSRQSSVSIVAVDASNSVVLRGEPEEISRLVPIIRELDSPSRSQVALDTIYLNHANGAQIVPLIQALLNEPITVAVSGEDDEGRVTTTQSGRQNSGPRASSIAFHAPTNSLVIKAPPETQRLIRGIVSRLDIRRPQVLIEAVIVEIADTTARELGVQYVSGGAGLPLSAASFSSTRPNVVSAAGAALFLNEQDDNDNVTTITTTSANGDVTVTEGQSYDANDPDLAIAGQLVEAAVQELLNFNGFLFGAGGETGDGGVYGVLLSALQSDSQSNVLQVPSIVLLDNEEGTIQVGQEVPVVTGEAVGSDFQGGFRQIERKNIGNILQVKPQITAGNTVQLKLNLEVSSLGAFAPDAQGPITNESILDLTVSAEDGQTLVLGGLVDKDRRQTESKVPVLGDIPLLGNLFKGQAQSDQESTLMIFIRPTILRDAQAADSVTARKYDYVRQQQMRRLREGQRPLLDTVVQDYIGPGADYVPSQPAPDRAAEIGIADPAATDAADTAGADGAAPEAE